MQLICRGLSRGISQAFLNILRTILGELRDEKDPSIFCNSSFALNADVESGG